MRFASPLLLLLAVAPMAFGQARPPGRKGLPQQHEYQKQIRTFLATLTEKDFEPPRGQPITVTRELDRDEQFRLWVLALDPVRIGAKRSAPSVNLPSKQFTLSHIESPTDQTVIQPAIWAEPLVWLANWNYPGNPYRGSRALKLRAFVYAAQDMMMMDEQQEFSTAPLFQRADWFAPHLVMYAVTYEGVKDILPEATRKAFETGLEKMVQRVIGWGPKGEETFFDMQNAVAMTILHQTMDSAKVKPALETFVKRFLTEGEFYHPAGYFPDQGCFDTGYNGLTMFFATWIGARTDWKWAKDAVAQSWKLRGYLMLPEPDEKRHRLSPTHMTMRTASPVAYDQWNWPFKFATAGYITDDALCQATWPTAEEVKEGAGRAVGGLNFMLAENPRDAAGMNIPNDNLKSDVWRWRLWVGSPVFPMVNYGHLHYPKGFAAKLAALQEQKSPLLSIPFERPGNFMEQFDKGFLIAKNKAFGVVIHTGPVSEYPGKTYLEFPNAPYGLGGGQLSAFWTPEAGSAILGRRGGMNAPGGKPNSFDKPEEWRTWPVHAVTGATAGGKFFTSARIQKPVATYDVKPERATVKVSGVIPASPLGKEKALEGKLDYGRTFEVLPASVRVETTIQGDGVDRVAELYEVIPAFHREESLQGKSVTATIEFQSDGTWMPATANYTNNVTAIRIARFKGTVQVQLDKGRRVKLSPAETGPGWLTSGVSRNVLIDLLGNDQPTGIKTATVRYDISSLAR